MISRRQFGTGLAAGITTTGLSGGASAKPYRGPNVVLIRFGGGVRRAETIEEATTYAPYTRKVVAERGTLIPKMQTIPGPVSWIVA